MVGTQRKKGYQDTKKPFPGCMGMMLNVFDFTAGMNGTKLLTDKSHRDGVDVVRNNIDSGKKQSDHIVMKAPGKHITSDQAKAHFSNKSSGTPVKALIAQEMWKETERRQKPSNVVARLMGLDSLPIEKSTSTERKNTQAEPACNNLTRVPDHCLWQDNECFENSVFFDTLSSRHGEVECKDVHEVLQKPVRMSQAEDGSLLNGNQELNSYKTRMALVRQKFTEAKSLATDENLLHSKEFQDAIEVLSSNRDLLLKFLEEPNSLFSKYFCGLHNVPPPSEPKRITVLKPSITVRKEDDKGFQKKNGENSASSLENTNKHSRSSSFSEFKHESGQPTRIVVLKPSPAKTCEMQTRGYHNTSANVLDGQAIFGDGRTHETLRSRELAKEITRKMREHLSNKKRDESLLSSILSNGYIGDESSFNRSESEILQEESGSLFESEIMAPTLGHCWDNTNRLGSPFSVSSSRASLSPESAVVQEAKRRLSERWALVSSNVDNLKDRQGRKNSSTLGEMLAVNNDVNAQKGLSVYSNRLFDVDHDLKVLSTSSSTSLTMDEFRSEVYPQKLQRSKSLPISSLSYDAAVLNLMTPASHLINDSDVEVSKLKNVKSCFKDKVSSFFFSRNRKETRESSSSSIMVPDDRQLSNSTEAGHKRIGYSSKSSEKALAAEVTLADVDLSPNTSISSSVDDRLNQDFSAESDGPFRNFIEQYELPSLDPSSTNGICSSSPQLSQMAIASNPQALGRSQPIGSVARSLTSSHFHEEALSSSLKPLSIFSKVDEEHEQFAFIQTLIESAGLSKSSSTIFTSWHSLGSPMNPILLDDYLQMEEEEAKCKLQQSSKRLLFDCANAAILDISNKSIMTASVKSLPCYGVTANGPASTSLAEEAWGIISNWFPIEHCVPGERYCSDTSVDRLATKEATGPQWDVLKWLETYEFSKEISGRLLEELVEEASSELI